jgi:hypothetical protein
MIYVWIIEKLNRAMSRGMATPNFPSRHISDIFIFILRGINENRAKADLFTRLRLVGRSLTKIWVKWCLESLNRTLRDRRKRNVHL